MKRSAIGLFLCTAIGFAQTPVKDADTLQSLLAEVHQLRQAIEGMTAASQRVQIALHGLQLQDAAVARSTQRFDSARNRCSGMEETRKHVAVEVQRMDSALSSTSVSESDAKEFKARLPGLKSELEAQTANFQNCRASEDEAVIQLRTDQAKLTELQDRITRLDKALEQLGSGGNSKI